MSSTLSTADWRKPTITVAKSQRIRIAQSAIEKALSNLSGDGRFSTNPYGSAVLYSSMAEFDFVSNGTQYKDQLARYLEMRAQEKLSSSSNFVIQELLEFGHAAIRAYASYKDDVFLKLAIAWWQWARGWTVSDTAASSKSAPGKSSPLPSSCSGHPIVGGTFHDTNPTNSYVETLPTGSFLILSSLLAEATSNRTYLDQATQTFSFLQNLLLNTTTMIPQESIFLNASSPNTCGTSPPSSSYCSGIWLEGLAAFSAVADGISKPDNQLISRSYISAMSAQNWHSANRILRIPFEDGKTYHADVNIPRGLGMLYQRVQSSQIKSDIEKYLAVQYNAILDLSTTNGTDIYSFDWAGPSLSTFDSSGQVTALGVLIPVIALPDTNSTPQNSIPSPEKKAPVGGIVGGVVGGILLLAALIVLFVARRRRKKKTLSITRESDDFGQTPDIHVVPFIGGDSPHLLPTRSGSSPSFKKNDHQLLRNMGEALNMLNRRLDMVEGTTSSDMDSPPSYPGSEVQNHSQMKGERVLKLSV